MLDRRQTLTLLSTLGLGGTAVSRAIAALVDRDQEFTKQTLLDAEWITGVSLDENQRESILNAVSRNTAALQRLRAIALNEETPMALGFTPLKGVRAGPDRSPETVVRHAGAWTTSPRPQDDQLAFLPVTELGKLIRARALTSTELTKLYLDRLKRFDPVLNCVVNLTETIAMEQADRADREIAAGRYRGSLHGIPWGAKDLISVKGYPCTWGIPARRNVVAGRNATVAQKLEDAGAVLVAKLSLGALAMGDKWFGGMTRSPWDPSRGSSGSSAGSAAATVAGLVGFAIGSETLGSIISPSARCGATSLRPTFGRISRDGCMPLAWSLDKLGPMCRSVADCATVFAAIHGEDGRDPSAQSRSFAWPVPLDFRHIRVGVPVERLNDDTDPTHKVLREMGVSLVGVELPDKYPLDAILNLLDVEAAAMFDEMLRAGNTEGWNRWPDVFHSIYFTSAVDYVRMQRVRWQLMQDFEQAIAGVDFLCNADDLRFTNLTGHPSAVLPRAVEFDDGKFNPKTVVLTGHAYDDDRLLTFAHAFEREVRGGLEHPPMERWLEGACGEGACGGCEGGKV